MTDKPNSNRIEKPKKRRLPKLIAKRIDVLYEMRAERLKLSRTVEGWLKDLVNEELALAKEIHAQMRDSGGLTSASGAAHTFTPGLTELWSIADPQAYWEYARKNDAPELYEQRPGKRELADRYHLSQQLKVEKKPVPKGMEFPPGAKRDTKFSYSLTKKKASKVQA